MCVFEIGVVKHYLPYDSSIACCFVFTFSQMVLPEVIVWYKNRQLLVVDCCPWWTTTANVKNIVDSNVNHRRWGSIWSVKRDNEGLQRSQSSKWSLLELKQTSSIWSRTFWENHQRIFALTFNKIFTMLVNLVYSVLSWVQTLAIDINTVDCLSHAAYCKHSLNISPSNKSWEIIPDSSQIIKPGDMVWDNYGSLLITWNPVWTEKWPIIYV